jgi:hypothetical protein
MRLSRAIVFVVASLIVAACSGSTASDLFGTSGGPADGGSSGSSGGHDASTKDSGGDDASPIPPPPPPPGQDSGVVVTEKPAPICHDLTQHDSFVVPSTSVSSPPPPNPLTTFTLGLYVATSIIEYNTNTTIEPPQKITADITATRYYYLYETASERQPLTTDWSITNGTLTRNILCTPGGTGTGPVKQRIDAASSGYIIWTQSRQGNPLAVKYTRSN